MIVFDLLTGFLGSGKTTLLNAYLRLEVGQDTAVIVNEFGAIGLDQLQSKNYLKMSICWTTVVCAAPLHTHCARRF